MNKNRLNGILWLGRTAIAVLAALAMGLAGTIFLATPVRADVDLTQIDLVLGGEAAMGWNIEGVMPCDSGSETVTLTNNGALDGFVTIWVDNIQSSEGDNPESETDTDEPGELDDHLLFNLTIDPPGEIHSNVIPPPTTIDNFPHSYGDTNYIHIPLGAGDTVTLHWEWELPCDTGNEAQGDCLSFNIHYVLEGGEEPPPPPFNPPPPPGTGGCSLMVNLLGDQVNVNVDCCSNSTYSSYQIYSPDGESFMSIDRWTCITCGGCAGCNSYPVTIEVTESQDPPPPPDGAEIIGPVYDFIGYRGNTVCPTVVFGKPVVLLFGYDPGDLPENAISVVVAFYNEETGDWEDLPPDSGRVAEIGEATAMVNHLSTFAVLAKTSPPPAPPEPPLPPATITPPTTQSTEPAHFVLSNLQVVPTRELTAAGRPFAFVVRSGESVTVTASLANDGGEPGSYAADLLVDGQARDTKSVSLSPGQNQEMVFTLSGNAPGNHTLELGGLQTEFATTVWVNWWLIGGLIAAVALGIWAAWHYGYRRRRG